MSNYDEAVDRICEKCSEMSMYRVLQKIESDQGSLEGIWNESNLDDHLEQLMVEQWSNITDTSNAYWLIDHVTAEDKMFLFRKLKADIQQRLRAFYAMRLVGHTVQLQKDITQMWNEFLIQSSVIAENGVDTYALKGLRSKLNRLVALSASFERCKRFVNVLSTTLESSGTLHEKSVISEAKDQILAMNTKLGVTSLPLAATLSFPAPLEEEAVHEFERKLRGGFVSTVKPKGAFVPESDIRRMDFKHGDLLRIVKAYRNENQARYEFEVAEKISKAQPERVEVNYGLMEQEATMFYVEKYAPNIRDGNEEDLNFRWNDAPYRIMVKEEDIRNFTLQPGDRVDIAFWANNPLSAKVIWKHRIE